METENMTYGLCMYDVPIHRRKLYSKIRKAIGKFCIMQTWSCYLFPWGMRDKLESVLEELNEDAQANDRVMWRLLLQDSSQAEIHEQMVFEGLKKMLKDIRKLLDKRIRDAAEKIRAIELEGATPDIEIAAVRRVACRRAKKALKDAEARALLFGVGTDMADAFATYSNIIEAEASLGDKMPGEVSVAS